MKKGKSEEVINDIKFEIRNEYEKFKTTKKISHLFIILGFILTYVLAITFILIKIIINIFCDILYSLYKEHEEERKIYRENYAAGKGQADAMNDSEVI